MDVKNLLPWSEPKEIQTKHGPRFLYKAGATEAFWDTWRTDKASLKQAGISPSRKDNGEWEICWWREIPQEIQQKRNESIEQSRAVSANVELPRPDGLDYMPFQKAGIQFALDRHGVLIGDEMGLGKTIQAIGIINSDPTLKTGLVICPKSLKLNWKREMEKWLVNGQSVEVADGHFPETDIVIINYEGLKKWNDRVQAQTWGICIVDEAHYIKNSKAQRSKLVKAVKATRKVRLTGTPIVNRPAELYNIIEDLGGSWGSFFQFAKRYCNAQNNGWGWDFSGASNLDELQRRLRETIMVRRLKADVLKELPRKIRQIVEVEAETSAQKKAVKNETSYEVHSESRLATLRAAVELSKAESEEAYKAAVARLNEASRVDFTEMARLRHETALAKLPAIVDHLKNALEDNDNKIILAAHHHDVIDGLMEALAEFNPVQLTGENNEQERQNAVDTFQTEPACRVFIGSITAAGVGITLTASSHVVFAELDWVPGNITQMEDRAHRIGQTETVLVQHIVLSESLDARMARTLVEKQAVIDSALDINHPARKAPVYVPKESASTHAVKPDQLAEMADKLTNEHVDAIHAALRFLAGMDGDFANVLNGVGFNKIDSHIGHALAEQGSLSKKQAALGLKIARKYHRQLPGGMLDGIE